MEDWEWEAVKLAANDPNHCNAHWLSIVDLMHEDIRRYLAFIEVSRND